MDSTALSRSDSIVLIPTYNEKENIAAIIHAVFELPRQFHILIIDDNSVWRQPSYPLTRDYFDSEVEFEAAQEGIPYLQFNGDIALRYLIWYGAGRFWIEALRTDSLLLVPSIGLRVSQLVAGIAVVGGVIAEILLTKKFRDKPLMVELPLNSENRARMKKLDGPTTFAGKDTALPASASRTEFVEKTAAWNETVKEALDRREHPEKNEKNPE